MKKILLLVFLFSGLSLSAQGPTSDPDAPTNNSEDVISVFSGQYTDISGTNFNPGWGQAGHGSASSSYDTGSGNVVLAYPSINYQGIQLGSAQDVSDMEYLHLDIWINSGTYSPNIYLISTGPVEQAYSITNTGANSWISVDIPLTTFSNGGVDLTDVIQFKFDGGNGSSDAIYIDNLYFWKEPTAAGSDANLSDLKVAGSSLTGFSSSTTSYTYNVVEGTSQAPQITAVTTSDSNATTEITQASSIPGNATVEVTAQDGETTKTYTVSFAYVSSPQGTWKLTPAAGSLMVGGSQGAGDYWTNSEADVTTRACLFDDEYVFNADGSYENVLQGSTWLETWQNVSEGCGTPIAPHDGSNAATWSYNAYAGTITISGEGAFLGLSKAHNNGEDGAPVNNTIEYTVTAISSTAMTIDINVSTAWWRFVFTKQAEAGTDATLSDLKVDGSTISNFNYNTTSYTYGLPEGTTEIPDITAVTATDSNASTEITQASSIPGDATVVVTAQDGETTKTYTVSYAITKPAAAPSSPVSRDAGDVISVFSGAYTDISSTDFNPAWSQNGYATANTSYDAGDGNILLAYPNCNYQGISLGSATDASAMDYLHIDLWTPADPNATTIQVTPINNDGESNSEYLVSIDYTSKTWSSVDIPLSSFTGVTSDNVIQLKFATNAQGSTSPVDIYLDNIYFWKDEPTWTGNTDSDWSEAGNWDPALVPTSLADLTIPSDATITASENITVNSMSVASGASIISTGTITGDITYTRSIPTSNWYLISSPVSGQDIDAFVSASDLATGAGNNVAFANYNNSTAAWSYYQSGASGTGDFTLGQGHAIKLDAQGSVSFTGSFNASNQEISLTTNTNGFNLIGNSYLASVSVGELLAANNSGELAEQTIWLWNQASDAYVEKNLAADLEIAPGQGFFVKASGSATFDITESMQSHSSDAFQRPSTRPEIDLTMTDGTDTRGADIFYIEGTTTGFDNGYDSSIFEGAANEFAIYTHAVANGNGRNLGIQSLPPNNYENMIIPVGINAVSGTDITIDASTVNFPVGMNVYLEDKDDNSFTLLDSDSNFTTTLASDLNGIGRFYLHTTTGTLGAENLEIDNLSIYISSRENLRIVGVQNGTARVQLYNILGKEVLRSTFEGTRVNDIQLPSLAEGIYIVHLSTANGTTNKKIIIE